MQIQEDKPYDDINITPMLDLAYVLLVIFILMCTASVQGIKVNLPHASNAPQHPLSKPKTQAITVNNEGKYALNTTPMTLDEIAQHLTQAKAAIPTCRSSSAATARPVPGDHGCAGRGGKSRHHRGGPRDQEGER